MQYFYNFITHISHSRRYYAHKYGTQNISSFLLSIIRIIMHFNSITIYTYSLYQTLFFSEVRNINKDSSDK